MPINQQRLRTVLAALFLAGASSAHAASQAEGFWISFGAKAPTDATTSKVSYTYTNLYAGSLNPPGFSTTGEYSLKAAERPVLPSIRVLYVGSLWGLSMGYSISGDLHGVSKMSSAKFDFPNTTNQPDLPRGHTMSTVLQRALDAQIAIEPGLQLGSSTTLFLKIAYHQMSVDISSSSTVESGLNQPRFTTTSANHTFQGVGAGVGLRFQISDKLFLEPLYEYVVFNAQTVPASSFTSVDEISVTQSQVIAPQWRSIALSFGSRF